MQRPRRSSHTSLTETAALVVRELERLPDIKMIAPGIIETGSKARTGKRFITVIYTMAGFELIISGQAVQKIAVHTDNSVSSKETIQKLHQSKRLAAFTFKERGRHPGI